MSGGCLGNSEECQGGSHSKSIDENPMKEHWVDWSLSALFGMSVGFLEAQLQKVFLPPGTDFLRQNFPNIEEEFS